MRIENFDSVIPMEKICDFTTKANKLMLFRKETGYKDTSLEQREVPYIKRISTLIYKNQILFDFNYFHCDIETDTLMKSPADNNFNTYTDSCYFDIFANNCNAEETKLILELNNLLGSILNFYKVKFKVGKNGYCECSSDDGSLEVTDIYIDFNTGKINMVFQKTEITNLSFEDHR